MVLLRRIISVVVPEVTYLIDQAPTGLGVLTSGGDTSASKGSGFNDPAQVFTQVGFVSTKDNKTTTSLHRHLLNIPRGSIINRVKVRVKAVEAYAIANTFRIGLLNPDGLWDAKAPVHSGSGGTGDDGPDLQGFTKTGGRSVDAHDINVSPSVKMAWLDEVGADLYRDSVVDGNIDITGIITAIGASRQNGGSARTLAAIEWTITSSALPTATRLFIEVFSGGTAWDSSIAWRTTSAEILGSDLVGGVESLVFDLQQPFVWAVNETLWARLRVLPTPAPNQLSVGINADDTGNTFVRFWGAGGGFSLVNYVNSGEYPFPVSSSQTNQIGLESATVPFMGEKHPSANTGMTAPFTVPVLAEDEVLTFGDAGFSPSVNIVIPDGSPNNPSLGALVQRWIDADFYRPPHPLAFVLDVFLPQTGVESLKLYSADDATEGGWQLTIDYTLPAILPGDSSWRIGSARQSVTDQSLADREEL